MASRDKKNLSKIEYVTDHRTQTLAKHLDRYLRWGFNVDDPDSRFHDILIQVETDHPAELRDYVGHQDDHDQTLAYARLGKTSEFGVEKEMINNVKSNKFHVGTGNFKSDSGDNNRKAIIRITIAEAPTHPDFVPGSTLIGSKDGKPKDSKAETDKIKAMLTKEVQAEVGDDISNLDVDAATRSGVKVIGSLSYHKDTPIKAKYQFSVFIISFVWNDDVTIELGDNTLLNYQHKTSKTSPLIGSQVDSIVKEIKQACTMFDITPEAFIDIIDGGLN